MADSTDGNDQPYRITGDNHYHNGERLRTGDYFVPSETEIDKFGFKMEPVSREEIPDGVDVPGLDDASSDESDESTGDDAAADEGAQSGADDVVSLEDGDIPDDLDALSYDELQTLAKALGISANQSTEDLVAAIENER